ncbi:FMN-binding negative transcriptional regulator [Agrilutibacter solisilvae]|uniref:FMN-binding negative transcriptional regulator n=1 Tax=Agrilutibacter solisilvae TaxID=2763317 RepID=A0A975ARR1_9GAMM|nr:FMN-binding negative transcriptional regulator [Lysobacter solisilvae]QSX77932.1 FMN-binding negative transcriptional regulator [Lysobacter solisilvae]
MKQYPMFAPESPLAIDRMVSAYPFALLISAGPGMPTATPLPLLLERSASGTGTLIGHMARNNPQVDVLRNDPRALAVFQGPHGYISPSWLVDRTQAPTWNYETVHFQVEVQFHDELEATTSAISRLVAHMERGRPDAWSIADMGPRYASLAGAVIAFDARITATHAIFKLGQNERPGDRADILAGLDRTGQQALLDAMRRVAPEPAAVED